MINILCLELLTLRSSQTSTQKFCTPPKYIIIISIYPALFKCNDSSTSNEFHFAVLYSTDLHWRVMYLKYHWEYDNGQISRLLILHKMIYGYNDLVYILKQWIALFARIDWLLKLGKASAIYLRAFAPEN